MADKFISIYGVKLFYTETNEKSSYTIFFFHGNSLSHKTWRAQVESSLLADFRLIAFDHPAHGFSEGMPGGKVSYTLPSIAKLMATAVRQIAGDAPYILAGISLGTNIIAEMIAHETYPKGLLLAGPCIIGKNHTFDKFAKPGTKIGVSFIDEPSNEDINALIDLALNNPDIEKSKAIMNDFKAVKHNFRSSIGQSVADGLYSDEIALLIENEAPILVIFGADEKAVYPDYLDDAQLPLWRNEIIKLKGAGHWVHLDEPQLFTNLISDFASDIFSKGGF